MVQIYSTTNCKYCIQAKQWFDEKGVEYINYNVSEDPERREEMIEKTQQRTVPVIYVDDELVLGFDKDRLSELLNLK